MSDFTSDLSQATGHQEINSSLFKVEERRQLYAEIQHIESEYRPRGGNKAAEWRLRRARTRAIEHELLKLGQLALLSSSSLLTSVTGGVVTTPERHSNWRETLEESPMMSEMNPVQRAQLIGAKYENYTRVEKSIKAVGQMVCLSIRDLNDLETIRSFNDFKVHMVRNAFASDRTTDKVCEYCKWLGKAAQTALLKGEYQKPPMDVFTSQNGSIAPFGGQLSFISKWIHAGRRREAMTLNQARACAQMGNCPRSIPHPSRDQVRKSVKETVEAIQRTHVPAKWALDQYRKGLQAERTALGPPKDNKTHVSLISSGTVEVSNKNGGRAAHLVKHARLVTDQPLDFESMECLVGRIDQYKIMYISPTTWELAKVLLRKYEYKFKPSLGNILYVKPDQLESYWSKALYKRSVPLQLGNILNMTASKLITEVGHYRPQPTERFGLLTWQQGEIPKFKMTGQLLVKGEVSLEAGMKTRLTTSAMAAFAHLSQLPSNFMRSYLSQDPFTRVGFQEADKLWETLKAYRKANA